MIASARSISRRPASVHSQAEAIFSFPNRRTRASRPRRDGRRLSVGAECGTGCDIMKPEREAGAEHEHSVGAERLFDGASRDRRLWTSGGRRRDRRRGLEAQAPQEVEISHREHLTAISMTATYLSCS